jgi:hypothetical protein
MISFFHIILRMGNLVSSSYNAFNIKRFVPDPNRQRSAQELLANASAQQLLYEGKYDAFIKMVDAKRHDTGV